MKARPALLAHTSYHAAAEARQVEELEPASLAVAATHNIQEAAEHNNRPMLDTAADIDAAAAAGTGASVEADYNAVSQAALAIASTDADARHIAAAIHHTSYSHPVAPSLKYPHDLLYCDQSNFP